MAATQEVHGHIKTCFKCGGTFPLSDFYKHVDMKDGHLGKCKSCAKKYTRDLERIKSETDLNWVLSERARHREKSARARLNKKPESKEAQRERLRLYFKRHPDRRKAHTQLRNAIRSGKIVRQPCERCGEKAQAHHEDYSKPLEVMWLCTKHHMERHIQINAQKVSDNFLAKAS